MKNFILILTLTFLLPVFSFSQTVVKGTVFSINEEKVCDLFTRHKTEKLPGIIVNEKGTKNKTVTDRNGHFSLTLTKKTFPDTIEFSFIFSKYKEIIIKQAKDTTLLLEIDTNIDCELPYYSFTNLSIYSLSNIKYTPYGLGLKFNFINPFFHTNINFAYTYSTNLSQNKFNEIQIGINNYNYDFYMNYIYQNYLFQDNQINLIRNKISLTKSCNNIGTYPTISYSYNKDNILNNSFSAYKFSLKKRIIKKSNFYFYLFGGIEYYNQFSYQAGGNIYFSINKLPKLNYSIGLNYDTFMNYNFLNVSLRINIMDIPYWPFRFRRY